MTFLHAVCFLCLSANRVISHFYIITNVKLLFPFLICGTRHDKQLGYSNKEKKIKFTMGPFMQKPLTMQHIRSKLFSLPLSKLHAFYNSCLVNHVTNPNSNEYKLTAIVLDIAGHRLLYPVDIKKDEINRCSFLKLSFANKGLDGNILHHKSVKSKNPLYFKDQ
jgi:hypothetical protein